MKRKTHAKRSKRRNGHPPVQNPLEKAEAFANAATRAFMEVRPREPRGAVGLDFGFGAGVKPPLGPPILGSAAKLAAALFELGRAIQLEQAEGDRCRIARAGNPEFQTHLDRGLAAAQERTRVARARVIAIKEDIRQNRIIRGQHCMDVAKIARELFGPDEPHDRLLPFGTRPAAGERKRPVAEPRPDTADDRHVQRLEAFDKALDHHNGVAQ